MEPPDLSQATVLAALVMANAGAIVTAFVSLKVGQAVSAEKVGRLEKDINALANMIRNKKEKEEENE